MMTVEQVVAALSDRNLVVVAERTGLNYHTVWRVATGCTNPAYSTIEKLSAYLTQQSTQQQDAKQ